MSTRRDPVHCTFFWRTIQPVPEKSAGRICRRRMTFQGTYIRVLKPVHPNATVYELTI